MRTGPRHARPSRWRPDVDPLILATFAAFFLACAAGLAIGARAVIRARPGEVREGWQALDSQGLQRSLGGQLAAFGMATLPTLFLVTVLRTLVWNPLRALQRGRAHDWEVGADLLWAFELMLAFGIVVLLALAGAAVFFWLAGRSPGRFDLALCVYGGSFLLLVLAYGLPWSLEEGMGWTPHAYLAPAALAQGLAAGRRNGPAKAVPAPGDGLEASSPVREGDAGKLQPA